MLSILLKLIIVYYVVKIVLDRFIPRIKGNSSHREGSDPKQAVKRFEDKDDNVEDADYDEL